ncbi:TetR/AcrR family transcriptional regulator [Phyllobacterium zundukense]|uniref:TetR family transcriptional regulator n=1 Tax=Phyllobacterium zundukense TaxID=1867719 RepID=A0A2N9VQH5_9HYPH|nr:TetR/AcrR family transcriptional regulator [Phyllobacterium zundukense]ATU94218.1 TetR family transcriptional regulator [Phyllobacterium zundukense]PIO41743.1 TetR family transcriptional regulator [Phyllobacterium zundukense]
MKDTIDRPYHHGDLRRAVIETAMGMLHEDKGWQFTLREVARRAGVSNSAPYKHFPDKAALLAEMALIGFDGLREALMNAKPRWPNSRRNEFFAVARAYVRFGTSNPGLYRLMFSEDAGKAGDVHLSERALAAFGVLTDLLERGQAEGVLRKRDVRGQAAACWAQMHGITLLTIDGLFLPEKVGPNALDSALTTLLEGLEN